MSAKDYDANSLNDTEGSIDPCQPIHYPGLPHGLTATHADVVNRDLLAFCQRNSVFTRNEEDV